MLRPALRTQNVQGACQGLGACKRGVWLREADGLTLGGRAVGKVCNKPVHLLRRVVDFEGRARLPAASARYAGFGAGAPASGQYARPGVATRQSRVSAGA